MTLDKQHYTEATS